MADVMYIDLPVGTGFSYGSSQADVIGDLDSMSVEFVNFLDTFLKMYPEYKSPR
jgi:carboxypeptidase C (cathepsin A)